jgi:hypothetical protein
MKNRSLLTPWFRLSGIVMGRPETPQKYRQASWMMKARPKVSSRLYTGSRL